MVAGHVMLGERKREREKNSKISFFPAFMHAGEERE
jgi:hypothetical protein